MIWEPPRYMSTSTMTTNSITGASAPHNEGNLNATDINTMLEGFIALEKASKKLKEDYGRWNVFLHESIEELA